MDKQPTPRYKLWSAAADSQQTFEKPQPPLHVYASQPVLKSHSANPQSPFDKLSALETSLLIYGSGASVEAVLESLCTYPSGQATKCKTKKISSEAVDFAYYSNLLGASSKLRDKAPLGSPVRLTVDELGPFRGTLTSQSKEGFQVAVDSVHQRVLSAKLAQVAAKRGIHPKVAPGRIVLNDRNCSFFDPTGTLRKGTVITVSQTDILISSSICPPAGAFINFRGPHRLSAQITSSFDIGFMAKFSNPIPAGQFSVAMKFFG